MKSRNRPSRTLTRTESPHRLLALPTPLLHEFMWRELFAASGAFRFPTSSALARPVVRLLSALNEVDTIKFFHRHKFPLFQVVIESAKAVRRHQRPTSPRR